MITFERKNKEVLIKIQHGIWTNNYFERTINQDYEYQAELLTRQLNKHLNDELSRVRRDAYNEGWKDAKAKRAKRTQFTGWWK